MNLFLRSFFSEVRNMGKIKKKKRITFKVLLLRGTAVVLILTIICACFVSAYFGYREKEECTEFKKYIIEHYKSQLSNTNFESAKELDDFCDEMFAAQSGSSRISSDIYFRMGYSNISPVSYNEYCFAAALADKDGSIISSRKMGMLASISGYPGYDDKDYYCFNDFSDEPEIEEMFKNYSDLAQMFYDKKEEYYLKTELDSIYVDNEKQRFVPHEGKITLYNVKDERHYVNRDKMQEKYKIVSEYKININFDDSRYELITAGMTGNFPQFTAWHRGAPDVFMDMLMDPDNNYRGYYSDSEPVKSEVVIGDKKYDLYVKVFYPRNSSENRLVTAVFTIPFFILSVIIMLFLCWRKNVRNKARYRFEDFQKNITDYLITNISGPVEAIEKYTKDLIDNNEINSDNVIIDENKESYESIIENVRTVDKIVSDALFYNNMDRIRKKTSEEKQLANNIPPELVKNIL